MSGALQLGTVGAAEADTKGIRRQGGLRRLRLQAWVACLAVALAACSGAARRQGGGRAAWTARLPWGAAVAIGRTPLGTEYGPLAAALGSSALAVADSFGRGLLLWRRQGGRWAGPRRVPLSGLAPVVALAWGGPGDGALAVADAVGALWLLQGGRLTALGRLALPGALLTVDGLAVSARDRVWVDVTAVRGTVAWRGLDGVAPGGRPAEPVATATLAATGDGGAPGSAAPLWLQLPSGARTALASGPGGQVWVLGRADGASALWRINARGQPVQRCALPEWEGAADLVGVAADARGLPVSYLVLDGRAGPRLLTIDCRGGSVGSLNLAPPGRPLLGQYAAAAPSGALLLLTAEPTALRLRWYARFP